MKLQEDAYNKHECRSAIRTGFNGSRIAPASSLPGRLFSAHLLPDEPGPRSQPLGLQQGFGVEPPKQVEQGRRLARPCRLVAGTKPGAVITVEVFMEEDQIAPVRSFRQRRIFRY